ncbi:MAG: ACT domain-containing protein [Candidatus Omnitrophota bacterium]
MVQNAYLGKEIVVTVTNRIGILADMSKILADHGINIVAVAGYATENEAKIMVVTEDNLRASDALVKAGYKGARENPVLIVELDDKPGALRNITTKLAAENIDIRYIYGTACSVKCPAKIVLSTSSDEKALLVFKK